MRLVVDIETDDLLPTLTKMHVLHAKDVDTKQRYNFLEGDLSWKELLTNATMLIGHNCVNFDFAALKFLFDFEVPIEKVFDTLLYSQALDYRRFGDKGHSLETWGEHLGFHKLPFNDFSTYTPVMQEYVERDVDLGLAIFEELEKEYTRLRSKTAKIETYMKAEHYAAEWSAMAKVQGWPFNMEKAVALFDKLSVELQTIVDTIEPKLGMKAVLVDKVTPSLLAKATTIEQAGGVIGYDGEVYTGEAMVKYPVYLKDGRYNVHTSKWFNIDPLEGLMEDRLIDGAFCRVDFVPLKLSSHDDVKIFLYRNNWIPTSWNTKKDPVTGAKVRSSPKITEDSIEFMGGDAKLYFSYLSMSSRYGILKTWIESVDADSRLHGDMMLIGTPSMRARHSIIANVPSADAVYGKEMRELFETIEGWTMIGADSAGNQARGLAHYLKDESFIDIILNGDIHIYDANKLTESIDKMIEDFASGQIGDKKLEAYFHTVLVKTKAAVIEDMKADVAKLKKKLEKNPEDKDVLKDLSKAEKLLEEELQIPKFRVTRKAAKRVLYAFLFGAAGGKLWSYIFGELHNELGKYLKANFESAIPGFNTLVDKLKSIYKKTKVAHIGWFPSIAGNRVYVDSQHKLLVYLLQSAEKVTCSTALMLTVQKLREENIPYIPLIYYHDEIQFTTPNEYAERAAQIAAESFKYGPKLYGIEIMDGAAHLGSNWFETH